MAEQKPIDDALLGKFLAGETNPAESARVRQWLANPSADFSAISPDDFARFERIWDAAQPDDQPTVDTNAAWRMMKRKMHSAGQRRDNKAEWVNEPFSVQRTNRYWNQFLFRAAAVLVLVAGMGWLTYKLRFMGEDHPARNRMTLVTNNEPIRKTLSDGTTVFLNRHSTLSYPATFTDDRRDVTLTGEAFFDVSPNASRPFRIQARQSVVQVLGTSFSVKAYDANVSVAVRTGRVRFSIGKKSILLIKNQQATVDASADTIRQSPQLAPNAFAYKTGQLVFNNEPLRDVIQAINQFYNADVRLANAQLGNCRLTTRFDKMPLDTVLTVTAETLGLRVRREGKQVILAGTGCQ